MIGDCIERNYFSFKLRFFFFVGMKIEKFIR